MRKLRIEKRGRGNYWVENIDDTGEPFCGPYKNRQEAVEAREGLLRTLGTKAWQDIELNWQKIEESFQTVPLSNIEETTNGDAQGNRNQD
jgi:hypothetical protein